jgi:hypothetical protein
MMDAATAFWEGLRDPKLFIDAERSPALHHTCECAPGTLNITVKGDAPPIYNCPMCGAEWEAVWTVDGITVENTPSHR